MKPTLIFCIVIASLLQGNQVAFAQSALSLLGTFDEARIASTYPPTTEDSKGDLAKLVYRLRSLGKQLTVAGESPVALVDSDSLGDAVTAKGVVTQVRRLVVPERLVEYLEFEQLQVIDFQTENNQEVRVVTTGNL